MADWNGAALRRGLCSAERLSDWATALGLPFVKTLGSRSSALLPRVTAADHICGDCVDGARPAALAPDRPAFPARLCVARGLRAGLLEAVRFTFFGLLMEH